MAKHSGAPIAVGLEPQRITVDEFWEEVPRKLELVNGVIPGWETLLLVILRSIGLRRAIQLVGYDLWARALEAESPKL